MRFVDFSKDFVTEIIDRIASGASIVLVCKSMNLNRNDFYNWVRWGEVDPDREPYADFSRRVKEAKADFLRTCIKEIKVAGRKHWQANAWLLEKKLPDEFSDKFKLKKYPQHLMDKPYKDQGNEIFKLLVNGELSLAEAHSFVEILAKLAGVEEISELKQKVFEFEQANS